MNDEVEAQLARLRQSLHDLEAAFDDANRLLHDVADDLSDRRLPHTKAIKALSDLEGRFTILRSDLGLDDGVTDLESMREAIEVVAALDAVEDRRAGLLTDLAALQRLEHVEGDLADALAEIRSSAHVLSLRVEKAATLAALQDEGEAAGPLVALARLVSQADLSDYEMTELMSQFGDAIPNVVAVAAVRKNLRIATGVEIGEVDGPTAVEDSNLEISDAAQTVDPGYRENQHVGPGGEELEERRAAVVRGGTVPSMDDAVRLHDSAVKVLLDKFPPAPAPPSLRDRLDPKPRRARPINDDSKTAPRHEVRSQEQALETKPEVSTDVEMRRSHRRDGSIQGTGVEQAFEDSRSVDAVPPTDEVSHDAAASAPNGPTGVREDGQEEPGIASSTAAATAESAQVSPDDVWRLVASGRLALAYHLAQALEDDGERPSIPGWLVGALALGPHVRESLTGTIGPRLAAMLDETSDEVDPLWGQNDSTSLALLVSAATLLPAIIAPNTGVITLIQGSQAQVNERFPNLSSLLGAAAEFCARGNPLDLRRWRTVDNIDTWNADRSDLQLEASEWLDRASHLKASYQPATEVWYRWLQPNGPLGSMLRRVIEGGSVTRAEADELIAQFQDAGGFGAILDTSFRDVLGKRWRGQHITGNARRWLERNAAEAVDLIDRWAGLIEQRPDAPKSYETLQAEQLKGELEAVLPAVLDELAQAEKKEDERRAAVTYAHSTVKTLASLVAGATSVGLREPSSEELDALLNDEIALCRVDIDTKGAPFAVATPSQLTQAIRAVVHEAPDWKAAFERRLAQGDAVGAQYVLRRLQAGAEPVVEDLERQLVAEVDGLRHQIEAKAISVQKSLEVALSLGLLGEEEHVALIARLNPVESELSNLEEAMPRFDRIQREMDEIEESIAEVQSKRKDQIERHVQHQDVDPDSEAYRRIRAALDENDFVTASEYLSAAVENATLFDSSHERRDAFHEFFVERFAVIAEVIRKKQVELPSSVRNNSVPRGAVDMKDVPKPQAEAAAELLETWFSIKRKPEARLEERLEKVLSHLGFVVDSVAPLRTGGADTGRRRVAWFRAVVQHIANRVQCPVPQFGSAANGRYRLLCLWDRQGEEDIVNVIGAERHGAPVMVFHFGTVTEARRRTIARLAKQQRKHSPFIVVDDAAILFLCGERGARMPVLFDILLPFASLEPYTTTASQVPAEMFYGRDSERRALRDPHGSSFVYGGRQLGKTALLRAVESEAHDPDRGQIAAWIDLKSENIGISRKPTDLWHVIMHVLKAKIAPHDSLSNGSVSRLEEAIKTYLAEDPERRILLLLDEADKFLESDTTDNFAVTSRLKGLMDATDRRFKVVLAGLHNVQRTTRHVNQPLAHYGDPICVGPLLQNGEVRAARELIQRPFAALGYRFASDDLVTRILGQTNYYPSLIQLYCMHLLRHLMDVPFSAKTAPPYVITSDHLDEVYRSQELHKAIRSRFQLTLDLDQRYEVLALTIAYLCLDDPKGLLDGYATQTIRDEALSWWAAGFESDSSLSAFEALLDEMIGLGVLRRVGSRKFTLRNRNVMDLMGSKDDIEARLIQEREPAAEFEPSTFRSQVGPGDESWLSPLTAQQETALVPRTHGVTCVFGTPAADLAWVNEAFTRYDGLLRPIQDVSDTESFERALDTITTNRKDATIVLVDPMCPWTDEWVAAAMHKIKGLRSRDRFVRVVFAGTADTLRALHKASSWIVAIESDPPVSLGPWGDPAVRTWLASRGYPNLKPEDRMNLRRVTGYWPILVRRFANSTQQEPANWATQLEQLDSDLENADVAQGVLDQFSLGHQKVIDLLAVLEGFGEATAEELATLLEPAFPLQDVHTELLVGTTLRYIQPAGHGTYRVDPVVGRLARVAQS